MDPRSAMLFSKSTTAAATVQRQSPAASWIGLGITLLGGAVLAGYVWQLRPLVQIKAGPGNAVVINSAISFVLAGSILLWPSIAVWARVADQWQSAVTAWLSRTLLILNALVLFEIVSGQNLGLDWPAAHRWLLDFNPHAGRMAPNTCAAFLAFAVAALLLPRVQSWQAARPIRYLTVAVLLLGVTGVVSDLIGLEVLYSFEGATRMAPLTGGGLIALSVGSWLSWRKRPWNQTSMAASGRSILSAAAIVLVVVVVVAGIGGFFLLQKLVAEDAIHLLSLRREERAYYIQLLITQARQSGRMFAESPDLTTLLRASAPGAPVRQLDVPRDGFTAAVLYNSRQEAVARSGTLVSNPSIALPLPLPPPAAADLLWSNGFVLRQRLPVDFHGARLGTLLLEQPLPLLASIGVETAAWGQSGEMGLCGLPDPNSRWLECFPQRLRPYPFEITRRFIVSQTSTARPMSLALEGKTGVMEALDYRGRRVLAAYAPIPELGLGFVVKMDLSELFASIRHAFEVMLPLLIGLTIGGLEVLRWQVRPLVRDLVQTRNQALYNEARFRAAAESSLDGFYIFEAVRNPHTGADTDFQLRYLNPPGERLAGVNEAQALGQGLRMFQRLAPPERLLEVYRDVVRTGNVFTEDMEVHPPEGKPVWLSHQSVPLGDGVATTVRDITERKHREERLLRLAQHDPLTGLPNRRAFMDRLAHAMESSRRLKSQELLALLYLDLDDFKQVNDQLGHGQGDRLLLQFAHRLRQSVRVSDTVARMGGDEFTILLENLHGPVDAERVVAAIFQALITKFDLNGQPYQARISLGLAFFRGENIGPGALLERADVALYQAKRSGRNRFVVYTGPAPPAGGGF